MAGSLAYTVILDACVLYPAPVRDILLSFAEAELFRARWTTQIHDEWTRNLLKNRPDLSSSKMDLTVASINAAVEDCLVENYEYLIPDLILPDPDDRHVLAAAIAGHADAIVTFNLKDFPADIVGKYKVEILHPDDFFVDQFDLEPMKALTIIKSIRTRLKKPPITAEELIMTYESLGLVQTSNLLREAIHLI